LWLSSFFLELEVPHITVRTVQRQQFTESISAYRQGLTEISAFFIASAWNAVSAKAQYEIQGSCRWSETGKGERLLFITRVFSIKELVEISVQ
jgi:hypothetical protein